MKEIRIEGSGSWEMALDPSGVSSKSYLIVYKNNQLKS